MAPGATEGQYLTDKPRGLAKRHSTGFTLIELLVALAVLVILATVAMPSFQRMMARNEVAAEVMRIRTALAVARNTAVTRRTTISVCASPGPPYTTCTFDDWDHDWVIVEGEVSGGDLTGDVLLRVLESPERIDVGFNRDDRPIRFSALGWSQGYNGTFIVCGRYAQSTSVVFSNSGRSRVSTSDTSC